MIRLVVAAAFAGLAGQGAVASGLTEAEVAFLQAEGCAIGAPVLERAGRAGVDPEALTEAGQAGLQSGKADQMGDWLVLGPELCRIVPQPRETELSFESPELALSAAMTGSDDPCVLPFAPDLVPVLGQTRGWSEDRAFRAYVTFLASGIAAGEVTFYSEDLLATPMGPRRITGSECSSHPDGPAMVRSNAWLMENTDPILRAAMESLPCGEGVTPMNIPHPAQAALGIGEEVENAWVLMDLLFVALGSGWLEGYGVTAKGMARPPLCNPALDAR